MGFADRGTLFGALAAVAVNFGGVAQAEPATQPISHHGQVFMLSGLLGEVLSPGLQAFADKIRARGIPVNLASHLSVGARTEEAVAAYRAGNQGAIVIVGHSLGAQAAVQMARALQEKKIPVRLMISIGPTEDLVVPANVASVVNYYQSASMSKGRLTFVPGFRGSLSNIDLQKSDDTNHFNMVKSARLQGEMMNKIVALVSANRDPQPNPARPPETAAFATQHGVN